MSAFAICAVSRSQTTCLLTKSVPCRHLSVSADEVNKFSALSSTWWDETQNPLISMNPTRIARVRYVLDHHLREKTGEKEVEGGSYSLATKNIFQGLRALDVGCGGGLLSESLARLGADVTAIDPSKEILEVAKKHASRDNDIKDRIDFRGGLTVEGLASELLPTCSNAELFDFVCVLEVIEHSPDPKSLLSHAASLLKKPTQDHPGGVLFVSTINKTAKSYAFAIIGAEYIARLLPIGTHR